MTAQPVTDAQPASEALFSALRRFKAIDFQGVGDSQDALEAIIAHRLKLAIMPGVRPATTFEAAYEAVYGLTLEGKAMKPRKP